MQSCYTSRITCLFGKLFALIAFSSFHMVTAMAEGYGIVTEELDTHNDSTNQEQILETTYTDTISADAAFSDTIPFKPGKTIYTNNDTTWINPVLGSRVHLQRLDDFDTLVVKKRKTLTPILESLGINFSVWAYDRFYHNAGWAKVDDKTIKHNLECSWILDCDSYSGNQFSHPFHGSMFYNAARYHGHSYYASALYPLVGSFVWEYFCETNEPSYNDFLSTGIGGSAIGEATYRISDIVFDNSKWGVERIFRELIGGFLNPARGVHRLFSGQMWHRSQDRGKMVEPEPFSFDISAGGRFMTEMRRKG